MKRMLLLSLMVCLVANTAQADLTFSNVSYSANSVSFTTTGDLSGYALVSRPEYFSIGFEGDLFSAGYSNPNISAVVNPNISWSNAIFSGASISQNGYSGNWTSWNTPGAWLKYSSQLTSSSQALGSDTTLTLGGNVLNTSSRTGEIVFYWETNHLAWSQTELGRVQVAAAQPQPTPPTPQPVIPPSSSAIYDHDPDFNTNLPTILITHGWNVDNDPPGSRQWIHDMTDTIEARVGSSNYNVVAWEWLADATGIPADWKAIAQGSKIATAFRDAGYTGDVHFIGHSLGGPVVTNAAGLTEEYREQQGASPAENSQVTILDSPYSFVNYAPQFAEFVDNYYTVNPVTGNNSINGAYNYVLLASGDHQYPVEWYQGTVEDTLRAEGFYWSVAGGGWSDRPAPGTEWQLPKLQLQKFSEIADGIKCFGDTVLKFGESGEEVLSMTKSSPVYAWMDLNIPDDAAGMLFDFRFLGIHPDDYLQVELGGEVVFVFEGSDFFGEGFINSGLLDISDYAGMTETLMFMLSDVSGAPGQMEIANLTFASPIPEPVMLPFLAFGSLAMLRRRRG